VLVILSLSNYVGGLSHTLRQTQGDSTLGKIPLQPLIYFYNILMNPNYSMKQFSFILILFLAFANGLLAQKKKIAPDLSEYEVFLSEMSLLMLNSKDDTVRLQSNEKFMETMEKALMEENSFHYPFESIETIAKLTAPDNTFRILNWHIRQADGSYIFYGFVQTNSKEGSKIYKLIDKSDETKSPDTKNLNHTEWYGAHYYTLIQNKDKKNKYYTLLGWDGNNMSSNKKIIDVIHFNNKGLPIFGAPIFKMEKKIQKRVIFEYAKDATMSLKYFENQKQIVFDHLSPSNEHLKDQYQYYGPDFSYDALNYKKGKWEYQKDIDARNPKKGTDKIYNAPK
jgi:hypothetical protein